jgi:hypothetical protein
VMRDRFVLETSGRVGRSANDEELRQSRGVLAPERDKCFHLDSVRVLGGIFRARTIRKR